MVKKDSLKISENYWENTHENKGKEDLNDKKICTRSHMSRICTVITYGMVESNHIMKVWEILLFTFSCQLY